jgi:Fe-S cluster assembly iron-binding protein IscA
MEGGSVIKITDSARDKIQALRSPEKGQYLRVYIQGMG